MVTWTWVVGAIDEVDDGEVAPAVASVATCEEQGFIDIIASKQLAPVAVAQLMHPWAK